MLETRLHPWRRLGLRMTATGEPWSRSHAMLPTPMLLEDRIRVFYATCDDDLRGRVLWADLSRTPPYEVIAVARRPALDVGLPGTFDCDGVNPSQVLPDGDRLRLLYIGWRRQEAETPYTLFAGLAESLDGGESFQRLRAPLLEPTPSEPLFRTAPFAFRRGGRWELLYIGGSRFSPGEHKALPIYSLKRARSDRLDLWPGESEELLAPKLEAGEIGYGRPVVWGVGDEATLLISRRSRTGYEMLQSPFEAAERGESDFQPVLAGRTEPWESDMTCFGAPLTVDGAELLFYNGNQYGRSGFGLAVR